MEQNINKKRKKSKNNQRIHLTNHLYMSLREFLIETNVCAFQWTPLLLNIKKPHRNISNYSWITSVLLLHRQC